MIERIELEIGQCYLLENNRCAIMGVKVEFISKTSYFFKKMEDGKFVWIRKCLVVNETHDGYYRVIEKLDPSAWEAFFRKRKLERLTDEGN